MPEYSTDTMIIQKLLIIDDDDDCNALVKFVLESDTDWQVSIASNGIEGLEKARSQEPDAILLDLAIPKQSGIDIYRQLKSESATCNIPVIFITAMSEMKEAIALEVCEDVSLITKPFDIAKLAKQVTEFYYSYNSQLAS